MPAVLWVVSCASAAIAMSWSVSRRASRFQTAFVFSVVAFALAVYGLLNIHVAAPKTVNGVVQWSLNSKWFFLTALVLGALSLSMTLWRRSKILVLPDSAAAQRAAR